MSPTIWLLTFGLLAADTTPPEMMARHDAEVARLGERAIHQHRLKRYEEALETAKMKVSLIRTYRGPQSSELGDALSELGLTALDAEKKNEAITAYEECLAIRRERKPEWKSKEAAEFVHYAKHYAALTGAERLQFHEAAAEVQSAYQFSDLGHNEDALLRLEKGIELRTKALGYADSMVAEHSIMRAHLLVLLGRRHEGLQELQKAIDLQKQLTGELHRHVATALGLRSIYEYQAGQLGDAEASRQGAASIYEQILGLEHETTQNTLSMLFDLQKELAARAFKAGKMKESRAAYQRAIETATKRWGSSSWQVADMRASLDVAVFFETAIKSQRDRWSQILQDAMEARKQRDQGNFSDAVRLFEKMQESMLSDQKIPRAPLLICIAQLAYCQLQNKQEQQALGSIRRYTDLERSALGLDHPEVVRVLDQLEEDLQRRASAAWDRSDVPGVLKWLQFKRDLRVRRYSQESWRVASSDCELAHWKKVAGLSRRDLGTIQALEKDDETLRKLQSDSRFKEGKALAQKVVDLRTQLLGRSDDSTIDVLHALGYFQLRTHDPRTPETCREVIELCKQHLGPNHPRVASALENLADWDKAAGAYDSAKESLLERISVLRRAFGEYHLQTARALVAMTSLVLDEDPGLAYEYQRQAEKVLSRLEQNDSRLRADLDNLISRVWTRRGDNDLALMYIDRAIEQFRKLKDRLNLAITLDNRAAIYFDAGHVDDALKSNQEAVDEFAALLGEKHPTTLQGRLNRVVFLARRNLADAAASAQQLVKDSRENLELLVHTSEEQRTLEMYESHRDALDMFLRYSLEAGWEPERMWAELLQFKGLVVREQYLRRVALDAPKLRPKAIALQRLTTELARLTFRPPTAGSTNGLQSRLKEKSEERGRAELALYEAARTAGILGSGANVAVADLRKLLPDDAVLIDFHVSGGGRRRVTSRHSHVHAFILTKFGTVRIVDFGPYGPIETVIRDWRAAIQFRQQPAGNIRDRLRDNLALPLVRAIGDAKLVLYSPEAAIGQIPFAALPGKQDGEVLLDRAAFVCVPVVQMLPDLLQEPKADQSRLLLLGDVDYTGDPGARPKDEVSDLPRGVLGESSFGREEAPPFRKLKGAAEEIDAIGKLYCQVFGHPPEPPLQKSQATRENLRRRVAGATYIHFATHGFASNPAVQSSLANDPVEFSRPEIAGETYVRVHPGLMSGIALTGANSPLTPGRDNGIITAAEMAEVDLRSTRLAVLSACETGLGDLAGGEGLIGLERALHTAGARTVVSTLWPVPDQAMRALMTDMYRRHWVDKMPAYRALQESQKALRDHWNPEKVELSKPEPGKPPRNRDKAISPYYWAGVIVSGSWK
jgi:CHAT domain-containing protein/tetratricopeptide (TPR) repeat protein